MARIFLGTLASALLAIGFAATAHGDPPQDTFKKTILIQTTMSNAKGLLLQKKSDPARAVQLLEENLGIIDGNRQYLMLLRDAYRSYIVELGNKGQKELADKYLSRLEVIEPTASKDQTLRPPALMEPTRPFPTAAAIVTAPQPRPPFAPSVSDNGKNPQPPAGNLIVRGVSADPDPFARANERPPGLTGGDPKQKQALSLLSQAETEFKMAHYTQAGQLFEQVHQLEPQYTVQSRGRWAYCKLQYVADTLNQPNAQACPWEKLEKEVHAAVALAPDLSDLKNEGVRLLTEIGKRRGNKNGSGPEAVAVKHSGSNAEGWQLAEGPFFRVYHKQTAEVAEKIVQVAERTRGEVHRKWFGNQAHDWASKCDIYIYNSAAEYTQQNKVAAGTPGHSHIESDRVTNKVVCRRIHLHCENMHWLETVLPHETTHVVIANQFGGPQVPRWADEGIAVLAEPAAVLDKHRGNLLKCLKKGGGSFPVSDLMTLQNYPGAERIGAFYAQSVSLVEFLTKQKGPQVFSQFLRDAQTKGYEPALTQHYGMQGYRDLQARWVQYVQASVSQGSFAER